MGKTRAQYQKENRERMKLQGKDYLKREKERTKKYKAPIASFSKEKQYIQREENSRWKRQSRERQRNRSRSRKSETVLCEQNDLVSHKSAKPESPLKVKINYNNTQSRKRISKAQITANKMIHDH